MLVLLFITSYSFALETEQRLHTMILQCVVTVIFGVSPVFSLLTMGQDLSCIKDLTSLYEAATIDDVYIAYDQLKVDADSLYTCIGIAGAQAGEESIGEKFQITNCFFGFIWTKIEFCRAVYTLL